MVRLGRHAICELWEASGLDDVQHAEQVVRDAVAAGRATLVSLHAHRFTPQGVSVVAVLAESHVSIHTWPEHGYVAADAFTCGDTDVEAIAAVLRDGFNAGASSLRFLDRGFPAVEQPRSFTDDSPLSPLALTCQVSQQVEDTHTGIQQLGLFTSAGVGRVMSLDGLFQVTDLDAFVYHELLVHLPMCAHPNPRVVGVVGGGDGLSVVEVLKHPDVERVVLMELDPAVTAAACRMWPEVSAALADPRVELRFGDAFETVGRLPGLFDVLVGDLPDPLGPAERMSGEGFYRRARAALASGGVLCVQSESLHVNKVQVAAVRSALSGLFAQVATAAGAMATYPGGWWSFTLASDSADVTAASRAPQLSTRLYRPVSHASFFLADDVIDSILAG